MKIRFTIKYVSFFSSLLLCTLGLCKADNSDEDDVGGLQADDAVVEEDIGKSREGSRTDDEVIERYVIVLLPYDFLCTTDSDGIERGAAS